MPSCRNGYQRVSYHCSDNDGGTTSQTLTNEELHDFADYYEDKIALSRIIADEHESITNDDITYDDFDTIDWTRYQQRDRVRVRRMKILKLGTLLERLKEAHDAWSGWLVLLLVGISTGLFAGFVDIGADWAIS